MTATQFFLHPAAIEEAESAARWYRKRSPLTAARFVEQLNHVIDKIIEAPQRWAQGARGTRKVKVPSFPFFVVYTEAEGVVHVLAVAHGRRRPGYWKNRL